MDLNEIVVFARVAQAGSFSAAARQLGLPKSTVSRKVSQLEDHLGARLLQRTTRKLRLTDAGRIYFQHATRILAEIEEASQAVTRMQEAPTGLLRVTAPLSFSMLAPIVAEFLRRYPDVQLEIQCTDRRVDLVEEGYDLAIRAGLLVDSTLVARPLGVIQRVLVAAPNYCKKNGTPRVPADLAKHACIAFAAGGDPNLWSLRSGYQTEEVRVTPRLLANDLEMMHDAVRSGIGVAWMPAYTCAAELRAGRLRQVLPDWTSTDAPLHAVYPSARHLAPKTAAFIELLREKLRL